MDFQVPQFIEIEDKIFGPLTFKQFVYVAGGAGAAFICYTILSQFLPGVIATALAVPFAGFGLALAFYKINERPLVYTMQAAIQYALRGKLYRWKKDEQAIGSVTVRLPSAQKNPLEAAGSRTGRLNDIAWSLDVHTGESGKE